MNWLWWAPLCMAALHIFEEFVFPGGFASWDRAYRSAFQNSISPGFHIWINALLLFACIAVAFNAPAERAVAGWLTLAALLFSNAIFHLIGTFRTKRYSPGIVTGLLLYVPVAVFGYWHFLHTGEVSSGTALIAAFVGGSYHLWSPFFHRLRARRADGL